MFDEKHFHVQNEKAAKVEAKSNEKIAKMQMKHAEQQAKREIVREKKANQEGVYKKLGPFTIKTWLILAAIVVIGIMMLVDKAKGGNGEAVKTEVRQESAITDQ